MLPSANHGSTHRTRPMPQYSLVLHHGFPGVASHIHEVPLLSNPSKQLCPQVTDVGLRHLEIRRHIECVVWFVPASKHFQSHHDVIDLIGSCLANLQILCNNIHKSTHTHTHTHTHNQAEAQALYISVVDSSDASDTSIV